MTRTVFRRALDWCVRNNVFIFSGKYYKQIDGCAMGSPLAPILADIFMNKLLENNIQRNGHDQTDITFIQTGLHPQIHLKLFVRYVDDTLAVFDNKDNALLFLKYLNSLHPSIKFTMECEEDEKLAFLDLLIIKSNGNVELTVYRKPTHSGVFTHFSSFIPHRYKVALVKTLICRSYRHCSSWHLFHAETKCITNMLMNNGYNKSHIKSIVGIFLSKCFDKNSGDGPKYGPEQFKVFIKLPYLGDISYKISSSMKSCLNQIKCGRLNLVFSYDFTRLENMFKFKDRQPKRLQNGVVYKITCSCGKMYIGETGRCLKTRISEHMKTSGTNITEVGQHLADNPTCSMSFEDVRVLAYENKMRKRRTLESLYIQDYNHTNIVNDNINSVPLNIFNIPRWR